MTRLLHEVHRLLIQANLKDSDRIPFYTRGRTFSVGTLRRLPRTFLIVDTLIDCVLLVGSLGVIVLVPRIFFEIEILSTVSLLNIIIGTMLSLYWVVSLWEALSIMTYFRWRLRRRYKR